jgi:hypothetical protein
MSIRKLALLLAVVVATCVGAETGHASNARTWVSNVGNDTGSCTVTSPCLTFAYALTQTSSGGEINCLNPGGFGAVTINISVTIDCEGVSNGGISVSSGDAITINTANIVVNLIGLDLNGENEDTAVDGVSLSQPATVNIRNCKIYGFLGGSGIEVTAGTLVVDNVVVINNFFGIAEVSGNSGRVSNITVRNSSINNNQDGIAVEVEAGGTHSGATIEQTTLAFNVAGLEMVNAGAVAVIGSSTVVNNTVGVSQSNDGIVYSAKNNQIYGNGTDGTPLTAYPGFSGGGA